MKIKLEIEIKPFNVPSYVVPVKKADGNDKPDTEGLGNSIPIADLEPETLSLLCDEFRYNLFKRAGKSQPPIALPG